MRILIAESVTVCVVVVVAMLVTAATAVIEDGTTDAVIPIIIERSGNGSLR